MSGVKINKPLLRKALDEAAQIVAGEPTVGLDTLTPVRAIRTHPHMQPHEIAQASALVDEISGRGLRIVLDGEEDEGECADTADTMWALLGHTDNDQISLYDNTGWVGWLWLVYGNGPGELIADYTANDLCEALWQHVQDTTGSH